MLRGPHTSHLSRDESGLAWTRARALGLLHESPFGGRAPGAAAAAAGATRQPWRSRLLSAATCWEKDATGRWKLIGEKYHTPEKASTCQVESKRFVAAEAFMEKAVRWKIFVGLSKHLFQQWMFLRKTKEGGNIHEENLPQRLNLQQLYLAASHIKMVF